MKKKRPQMKSGRMQRLPKPNWWSPTPCLHPALAALAQAPPPLSPWCTTWGSEASEPVFLLWRRSKKTAMPQTSHSLHLATLSPFSRLPNPVQHQPPFLPPTASPAPLNWVLQTWAAWGPLLSWSLPKARPSRLCRRCDTEEKTMAASGHCH